MMKIYHNVRCSKSRECLAFLEKSGMMFQIVRYIDNPLTADQLRDIIKKINIAPIGLIRQNEKVWIENYKDKEMSDDDIITAMAQNPVLIQRPIAVNGDKAVIARPLSEISKII